MAAREGRSFSWPGISAAVLKLERRVQRAVHPYLQNLFRRNAVDARRRHFAAGHYGPPQRQIVPGVGDCLPVDFARQVPAQGQKNHSGMAIGRIMQRSPAGGLA